MDRITIGKVVNAQGIKGELRVFPLTDDVKRYLLLDYVLLDSGAEVIKFDIEKVRFHKQFVLLKLKTIDDRNKAELYKKYFVTIEGKDAVSLEPNEYFMKDLYDIQVETVEGEIIGPLINIYRTAAQDVYVIKDILSKTGELLIPATTEMVKKVDIKNRRMIVSLIDGLREFKEIKNQPETTVSKEKKSSNH